MDEKVPQGDPLTTRTEVEGVTVDLPEGPGIIATGQVEGNRYEIMEMLGRGGMGEVWHAFDLKLRVEVALKALREDLFRSERRLELLRQEVRAAREVVSPNVCRIFDLIEIDGHELVSMEYVDGATLLGVLQERGPLELKEAQDIASQFLAGLEAIHKAGLVHRDVKPENIMLTRAGRVVVMDFGLARQEAEGGGSASGTPAYMAPEHAAGEQVDARADVYSAGVVLAEMVSPDGIKSTESRSSVWRGVRSEPAQVPDSPWAPVIVRAVARDRVRRQNSAHTLIRELEDVTLRVEGAEDLYPYPGLASFTESDAEYFFGREAEVEQMWRKLQGPTRMLALAGPSGAGKTSFLHAGLLATRRPGWSHIVCTPGGDPHASLRRAMISELEDDPEAIRELAVGDDDSSVSAVKRWARGCDHTLVIVDQFEELFTQNTDDEQLRFATLLSRLAIEADVFVLVSMRDDFLYRCHRYEALHPVLSDLTMLGPPEGAALRRALVQPATKCGYRFEDDELVEEMLAEVEGERGALPILAFAASRVWEKRDSDSGLLTRQATHDIGGVGGALAQHAEATVDLIGVERIPIVRELFRNLVTAEGTRAVREWDELLSVFEGEKVRRSALPSVASETSGERRLTFHSEHSERSLSYSSGTRESASEVLRELIDARLLTSYEVREGDEEPTRRIEIIHESLLANWPRLVRWQTQDADAAQLRDQLRQAARTWDEHGRTDDTLWTGSAYREYALWRERYPGGLTGIEKAFASAMTAFARRRRRRRRIAATAAVVIFAVVALVFAGLWRRSVLETRRAEAQKLIALAKIQLENYPTAALAYATKSIELSDSEEARLLALETLWEGPTAFIVNGDPTSKWAFSPGGNWLVQAHDEKNSLVVISRHGEQRIIEHSGPVEVIKFGGDDDLFLTTTADTFSLWSAEEGRELASTRPNAELERSFHISMAVVSGGKFGRAVSALRSGNHVVVQALDTKGRLIPMGTIELTSPAVATDGPFSPCIPRITGDWIAVVDGNDVSVVDVEGDQLTNQRLLGRHEGEVFQWCNPDPFGRFLVTVNRTGQTKLWDVSGELAPVTVDEMRGFLLSGLSHEGSYFYSVDHTRGEKVSDVLVWAVDDHELDLQRRLVGLERIAAVDLDPVQRWLAVDGPPYRLWSLTGPAGAEPIRLRQGPGWGWSDSGFSPDGKWFGNVFSGGITLWGLGRTYPSVFRPEVNWIIGGVDFGPEGRFLATAVDHTISVMPLEGIIPPEGHPVFELKKARSVWALSASPDGRSFSAANQRVWIGNHDGGIWELPGIWQTNAEFSPDGRMVSVVGGDGNSISLWDVETEHEISVLPLAAGELASDSIFIADSEFLTTTSERVFAWNIDTSEQKTLVEGKIQIAASSDDGRRLLVLERGESGVEWDPVGSPVFHDLDAGVRVRLDSHGTQIWDMALSSDGTVVATGDRDGTIRVGPTTGDEPHLLLGHENMVSSLDIDPLGRWVASGGHDNTIRLWPMPDVSKPPLHTLPREELIAKLKTLTNIRLVPDPESSTGWKLTHDPFPGWETVPTW